VDGERAARRREERRPNRRDHALDRRARDHQTGDDRSAGRCLRGQLGDLLLGGLAAVLQLVLEDAAQLVRLCDYVEDFIA